MSRNLTLYLGDETFEQAAEAAGWTNPGNGWFHNEHDAVESAEEACEVSGVEPQGDVSVVLPHRWAICSICQGRDVSTAHVECDGGGITASEMDELGDDFREDYLSGVYDRPCPHCEGGKVRVPDYSKMSKVQIAAWKEQCRDNAEIDAIERAERRAGC